VNLSTTRRADEVTAWSADLIGLGADYFFSLNRYLFMAAKLTAPTAR
jgi:hypothetical protein